MQIQNHTFIISGGSSGLGAATASMIRNNGGNVVIADINPPREEIAGAKFIKTDVTSDAKNACSTLCPDDKFVPNDGRRFISKVDGVTNVPKSRIYGAEADLQWLPVKGLLFDLGAAWLHTRVSEWQAVSNTSVWPNVVRFDASGRWTARLHFFEACADERTSQAHWCPYLCVEDIHASLAAAVRLGGHKLCEPMEIPGVGTYAGLTDPTGAHLALFEPLHT